MRVKIHPYIYTHMYIVCNACIEFAVYTVSACFEQKTLMIMNSAPPMVGWTPHGRLDFVGGGGLACAAFDPPYLGGHFGYSPNQVNGLGPHF